MTDHPAKYSPSILRVLGVTLRQEQARLGRRISVLDPMAGVGLIHTLASKDIQTYGVEIEPEWASAHPLTLVGDATALRFKDRRFHVTVTSPDYGNRMADSFDAKDSSARIGYRWSLGHPVSKGSLICHWSRDYRMGHRRLLEEMERVTKRGGLVIINVSDFIRGKQVVELVQWYRTQLVALDLLEEQDVVVPTPRMRKGQNYEARVQGEHVLIYRKP